MQPKLSYKYSMSSCNITPDLQRLYMTLFPLTQMKKINDVLYYIIKFGRREGERREGKKFQYTLSMLFILNIWNETCDVG